MVKKSLIQKKIEEVINNLAEGHGIYLCKDVCPEYFLRFFKENGDDGDEISVENIIISILEENNISKYSLNIDEMFENAGYTVYSLSVCWIENNELNSILNIPIELC